MTFNYQFQQFEVEQFQQLITELLNQNEQDYRYDF